MKIPETMTGLQLLEILAEQWGQPIPFKLELDTNSVIKPREIFIKNTCPECGASRRMTGEAILNLHEEHGFACFKCKQPLQTTAESAQPALVEVAKTIATPEPEPKPAPKAAESLKSTPEVLPEPQESIDDEVLAAGANIHIQLEESIVESAVEHVEERIPEPVAPPPPIDQREEDGRAHFLTLPADEVVGQCLETVEEALGYQPYGTTISFNEVDNTDIRVPCLCCGNDRVFKDREALLNEDTGLHVIVSLENMGEFAEDDQYHYCGICVDSMAHNDGKNLAMVENVDAKAKLLGWTRVRGTVTPETVLTPNTIFEFTQGAQQFPSTINRMIERLEEIEAESEGDTDEVAAEVSQAFAEANLDKGVTRESSAQPSFREEASVVQGSADSKVKVAVEDIRTPDAQTLKNLESGYAVQADSMSSAEQSRRTENVQHDQKRIFQDIHQVADLANPFEDSVSLIEDFNKSFFGPIIADVANQTGVQYVATINPDTWDIPVVDFASGVRIVCIDLESRSAFGLQENMIDRNCRFGFDGVRDFTRYYLYSDSAKYRSTAAIKAIKKIVLGKNFAVDRRVKLSEFTTFFTTDPRTLKEFETSNSVNVYGKPFMGRLGVMAVLDQPQKEFSTQDLIKMMISRKQTFKDMNMYLVASIRYLKHIDKDSVRYSITDYTELGVTYVEDGLETCMKALLKEHQEEFGDKAFSFDFEYDRTAFIAPSVNEYFIAGNMFKNLMNPLEGSFCYIKEVDPEFRTKAEDEWRQDQRFFSATTMANRFNREIKQFGIDPRDKKSRQYFLTQIGFARCNQPAVQNLMVSPMVTLTFPYDIGFLKLMKVDPSIFVSGGVFGGDSDGVTSQNLMLQLALQSAGGNGNATSSEGGGMDPMLLAMMMADGDSQMDPMTILMMQQMGGF